jgi:hypothetical protein
VITVPADIVAPVLETFIFLRRLYSPKRTIVETMTEIQQQQEEEREVLLSIYDGDPAFKHLSPTTFQYKVTIFSHNVIKCIYAGTL